MEILGWKHLQMFQITHYSQNLFSSEIFEMPHPAYLSISHQNMMLSPQTNPGTSHLRLGHLRLALTQVLLPQTVHSTLRVILALLTAPYTIPSEVPQCFLLTHEHWSLQILGSEIRNQSDNSALHAPKPPPSSWGHSDKRYHGITEFWLQGYLLNLSVALQNENLLRYLNTSCTAVHQRHVRTLSI